MAWLKDVINDMFKLLMSLSLKARTILVASIILIAGGYFLMDRFLDYKTEIARLEYSKPSSSDGKRINTKRIKAGEVNKETLLTKAEGALE